MKRKVSAAVVALFLLFAALAFVAAPRGGAAAQSPSPAPAAPPAAEPNPSGSVAGQTARTPEQSRAALNCQECHGPGRTLPYLAGAKFHNDQHQKYGIGHHARARRSNGQAAACMDCHSQGDNSATILPASDPKSTISRANVAITCGKCHGDPKIMEASGVSNRLLTAYRSSVHADAWARGNTRAATCTDCHNSHDVLPASDQRSPIFKLNIPQTCGRCHSDESAEFVRSVHGTSIARGNSQSPGCTDCHGIHNIVAPMEAGTALRTNNCARCHEGVRLTQEFGIAAGRVSSYEDSYHGRASRLGSDVVADCASCHGVHNILPSNDPRSMIHTANLTQTCGQCHPGASRNFARGKIHLDVPASQDIGSVGISWVRWIYMPLIVLTVGGMAAHNLLVWRRKAARKLRHERRSILRLTFNQRVQHWLLLSSFIVLVFSGFALVYPDSWLVLFVGLSEETRRVIHRVAAVVMMAVGAYHVFYVVAAREGRSWARDMLPRWKDVKDFFRNMGYYLGRRRERPKIARFGYAEKAEYWAVVWGTVIMGVTGLMIWFKVGWFGFLPRWVIDVAIAVHFYEAVLATLAIVVWHFYHVIFDPDVYPINWAFVDGRVTEELYKEEHEADFERAAGEAGLAREGEAAAGETTAAAGDGEAPVEAGTADGDGDATEVGGTTEGGGAITESDAAAAEPADGGRAGGNPAGGPTDEGGSKE